jgi:hypothetical protein
MGPIMNPLCRFCRLLFGLEVRDALKESGAAHKKFRAVMRERQSDHDFDQALGQVAKTMRGENGCSSS